MTESPTAPDLAALRNQLRQLIELTNARVLSPEQASGARAQLEKQILDRVLAGESVEQACVIAKPKDSAVQAAVDRRTWYRIGAFVVVVGASAYAWIGHPQAWSDSPEPARALATTPDKAPHPTDQAQIEAMVSTLADKLKKDPDNAEGWAMLARSHAVLGRFDRADEAYRKARALRPEDAQLLADHADTLAVLNGRQLGGEPAKLIEQALNIDPRNFKALSLAGTIAFQGGQHARAVELWQRSLASAPTDNPALVEQIKAGLEEARALADLPGKPASSAASGVTTVSGRVDIDPALRSKLPAEATVFIHARAAQGPKMPLAIIRKQVKDLPTRFTLSDAQSMSGNLKISGFEQLVVAARVSLSGEALPKPGDWEGHSETVRLGAQDVKIVIQTPVK